MSRSGRTTKKIAAKAAIPPAVLRTIAPTASAKMPTGVRYTAPPSTARPTPGCEREILKDVVAGEDRLAGEKGGDHRRQHQHEGGKRAHGRFQPQHGQPPRDGHLGLGPSGRGERVASL
jgi:hypothetical protein